MSTRATLVVLATSTLALAGCEPWVVGNGVFEEQQRDVDPFVAISVQDELQVEVTAGAEAQSVKVSGDENVLEHVLTDVVTDPELGKTLVVKTDVANIDSTHPLRVTVAATALTGARATEVSTLRIGSAGAETFEVHAGNGAEIVLSGSGGAHLDVELWGGDEGGASLDARAYIVDEADVELVGFSVADLHVDEAVHGTVSDGSTLLNVGEGACVDVTTSSGGRTQCQDP